jgi:hypothetical protein
LIALPIALLPLEAWTRGAGDFPARYLLLALPAYLGIAAAPGYLYCALSRASAREVSPGRRWWMRVSMATAIGCGAVGLWAATLMWIFGPPSLLSLVCAILLWTRFERMPPPPEAPRTEAAKELPPSALDGELAGRVEAERMSRK